jgi:putative peptidoglycan lipid II flippase
VGDGTGPGGAGEAAAPGGEPVRVGRALWISAATMASRVLGLARDQLFALLIGANRYSDAFVVAFRIPNLLRDLFAEGALSSAFVPTFADARRNRGDAAALALANAVTGLLLAVVGALTAAGILWAGPLVALIAPGYAPDQAALAAQLTRIMMPFLLLVSLAALAMGMLNAEGRFTAPALAPALFNVGSLAVGLGLWLAGWPPERAVVGWSVGTLLGGALQLAAQLPSLRAIGWRFRPRLGPAALADPGVRRIGRLMAAALVGLSATQVNILVNTIFASHEVGANTWLQMAFRLMQLPLGVFGVAIATVAGAGVARQVAGKDLGAVQGTMGSALRMVAFLNVPSAVGLVVLAGPIISLVYEHGRFGAGDAAATAQALVCYALGLYAYSAVKVFAPAWYALDQARVPVVGAVVGMASNVLLNVLLYPVLGFRGVALGTSLAACANFAVLAVAWRRRHGPLAGEGIFRHLARVLGASAVLALAAWGSARGLAAVLPGQGLPRQLALGLLPVAAGGLAYLAAAKALGIRELDELLGALRRPRPRPPRPRVIDQESGGP